MGGEYFKCIKHIIVVHFLFVGVYLITNYLREWKAFFSKFCRIIVVGVIIVLVYTDITGYYGMYIFV